MSGSAQAIANAANGLVSPFGGLGSPASYQPALRAQPRLAVAPAHPVAPIRLPPAHTWHPLPPVAFNVPKEPVQRSSGRTAKAIAKVTVPKAKLRSSYGRLQR